MDLISLSYALRALEFRSFRAAAKSLSVKQSALSRRVRALEDEIGVSLFERHHGGIRATVAGREFLARTSAVLESLDYAVQRANSAGRAETGSLRIGFDLSLASSPLRNIIVDYKAQWPHVLLEFLEGGGATQTAALRERRIDVGFVFGTEHVPGLESESVWTERSFVALPEHHALASRNEIALTDLPGETFAMRAGSDGSGAVGWLAERRNANASIDAATAYAISREALLVLVGSGFGVTIVAESATSVQISGVVFRPIKEPAIAISFRMVWLAGNDNPALRRFLSHVRAHLAQAQK